MPDLFKPLPRCRDERCQSCVGQRAFHYREPKPLAEELRAEIRKTAAIQRDPFKHIPATMMSGDRAFAVPDQRGPLPALTFTAAAARLAWTGKPVTDEHGAEWPSASAWLAARRQALGLDQAEAA